MEKEESSEVSERYQQSEHGCSSSGEYLRSKSTEKTRGRWCNSPLSIATGAGAGIDSWACEEVTGSTAGNGQGTEREPGNGLDVPLEEALLLCPEMAELDNNGFGT
mmetsp:Transcript_11808/g.28291  ORF Transcript_11808/g.28291 Transcript_11808/m.28291 type:complete len:106 (+) Transcript_11808:1512-1829(+)